MSGFYLMHRGWQENPVFAREEFSRRDAWVWLIESAAFKPTRVGIGAKSVEVKRGQLCYSLRYMAKAFGWDDARVRRFLSRLSSERMIECVVVAGQTLVTICNYEQYQTLERVGDAPTDAGTTQQRRSGDANKNEGNEGNESSVASATAAEPPDPREVIFGTYLPWLMAKSGRGETAVRSFLGKCCKTYGDGDTINALSRIRAGPAKADPCSALVDELKRLAKNDKPHETAEQKSRRLAEGLVASVMAGSVAPGGSGSGDGGGSFSADPGSGNVIDASRSEDGRWNAGADARIVRRA